MRVRASIGCQSRVEWGAEMLGWHKLKPTLFAADLNRDRFPA